ncbi:MAG: maleylpyruvate isomerase family mycothiol-dependent enzyme [Herpetosiphonaceae bacterium]|nr:maleylpyruvate isomerase family mycothiol-dependent enzyme [Herpetosiphonaceae bacterium]
MHQPQPILMVDRFAPMLDALLGLLSELAPAEWEAPTACRPWSVKELASHLLGGDIGILSRGRDGYATPGGAITDWLSLVALVNDLNERWVGATKRISPQLMCELLRFAGTHVCDYFRSLDPYALGGPVSWAGTEPAPVWFDLAREYTERWHHQQQIRDAVGRPGLMQPHFFAPVLDTFVRALPHTYRAVEAPEGTCITLTLTGDAGGTWSVQHEQGAWHLYVGVPGGPDAAVVLPQDVAWRLFTKGIGAAEAAGAAMMSGNQELGMKALEMVSVIA